MLWLREPDGHCTLPRPPGGWRNSPLCSPKSLGMSPGLSLATGESLSILCCPQGVRPVCSHGEPETAPFRWEMCLAFRPFIPEDQDLGRTAALSIVLSSCPLPAGKDWGGGPMCCSPQALGWGRDPGTLMHLLPPHRPCVPWHRASQSWAFPGLGIWEAAPSPGQRCHVQALPCAASSFRSSDFDGPSPGKVQSRRQRPTEVDPRWSCCPAEEESVAWWEHPAEGATITAVSTRGAASRLLCFWVRHWALPASASKGRFSGSGFPEEPL